MNDPTAVPSPDKAKFRQNLLLSIIGAGLFLGVLGGMWVAGTGVQTHGDAGAEKRNDTVKRFVAPGQNLNEREIWIAAGEARLKEQNDQIQELLSWKKHQDEKEKLIQERERQQPPASRQTPSLLPPPTPISTSLPPLPQASAGNGATSPALTPPTRVSELSSSITAPPTSPTAGAGAGIQHVTFSKGKSATANSGDSGKEETIRQVGNWLPAGSFGKGVLLGGLDAPAGGQAQSNPHPVLVKLQDNSQLPNRFRMRTRDCHFVGAGYGDISSERAYIRLETLSCVLKDGKILELPAQGYIAGEDGKTGMRGKLVTKEGQILGRAFLAGLGSGIGQSLSQSVTTLTANPLGTTQSVDANKVLEYGAYAGIGKAMEQLAQYYITLAEKTFPVIEIAAGRTVDVVLTKGVALGDDINVAWSDINAYDDNDEELFEP